MLLAQGMGAVGEHEEAMESETCGVHSLDHRAHTTTESDVTQEGSPTEEKAVQRDTQPAEVTTICATSRRL